MTIVLFIDLAPNLMLHALETIGEHWNSTMKLIAKDEEENGTCFQFSDDWRQDNVKIRANSRSPLQKQNG
ncbi:MAG: hypothetical protein HC936_10275 [Leptolyngbyaceae cyanobacterium SU_3_3]|nr:hypothetical protein [Leptolyngbyaceae cyanobacterium SU_3_3]